MFSAVRNAISCAPRVGWLMLALIMGSLVWAVGPADSRTTPEAEKAPVGIRPCIVERPAAPELTAREARKLAALAKTADDHRTLARYYEAVTQQLEAQAAIYDHFAAVYRDGPVVRNLMAPNTAARFHSLADQYRKRANANRKLAELHDKAATSLVADSEITGNNHDSAGSTAPLAGAGSK